MPTRTGLPLWPLALSLCGCVSTPGRVAHPGEQGSLGMALCPAPAGLEVSLVAPGGAAGRTEIQVGDRLVAYDGLTLTEPVRRKAFLSHVRASPGEPIRLDLARGDRPYSVKLRIGSAKRDALTDFVNAATSLEVEGPPVTYAMVVDEITRLDGGPDDDPWRRFMKGSILAAAEQEALKGMGSCPSVRIVDRAKVDQVAGELRLQMTGLVSADSAKSLGHMLGASHLVMISYALLRGGAEQTRLRLLEVETGAVLSSAVLYKKPAKR